MSGIRCAVVLCCLAALSWPSWLTARERGYLRLAQPVPAPFVPVILRGAQLAALHGAPCGHIRAYAQHNGALSPIPFQIDRRDAHGELLLDAPNDGDPLDAQAEGVLMAADLGERATALAMAAPADKVLEVELADPATGRSGWVYLIAFAGTAPPPVARTYVQYRADSDAFETDTYRMAFSRRLPMQPDTVQWFAPAAHRYGPDVLDVMKIRHTGRFLHQFQFERTQADYRSRLIGVRVGPVRIVRRTLNSVRMLLGIRSPTITVDQIGYAQSMVADIHIDIPFRIDWFFSDLTAFTTWDGNDAPQLPASTVYSHAVPEGFRIDGRMSDAEHRFNRSGDTAFAKASTFGTLLVTMAFDAGSPIRRQVYVMDDRTAVDPPEDVPGQFGNIGFRMTGWEALDRGSYHLIYQALFVRDITPHAGLRFLDQWR